MTIETLNKLDSFIAGIQTANSKLTLYSAEAFYGSRNEIEVTFYKCYGEKSSKIFVTAIFKM